MRDMDIPRATRERKDMVKQSEKPEISKEGRYAMPFDTTKAQVLT